MTGYGPLYRIDGPPPIPPEYGLLQAASSESVRIIPDVDSGGIDRWGNGVEVYPYPDDLASTFDTCATGSNVHTKSAGTEVPHPQFSAMTVYLGINCTSYRIWDQAEFKARAVATMTAVEGAALEKEFMTGTNLPLNPHLSDGNGSFPWGNTATTVANGFGLLELGIAASGRKGVIHCSPATLIAASSLYIVMEDPKNNVIRTVNGTLVVPGAGYASGSHPLGGHPGAGFNQEWIYATGPIDIRRSEIFVMPDDVASATDRVQNTITYRAERYYVVDWDTSVQTAVLVDRCSTVCGTPS